MRIIYLDDEFCCHLTDIDTTMAIETDIFDNKCDIFVEGYRFIPSGYTWIREDGMEFMGEAMFPIIDYAKLIKAQEQYEIDENKYTQELGALIEEIYNEDLEVIG